MAPQDLNFFNATASKEWVVTDAAWFDRLTAMNLLTVVERVGIARLALQQKWFTDIEISEGKKEALVSLGLHIATEQDGFYIVSGNAAMGEYITHRERKLTDLEKGILYGYPPSAVLAFTDIIHSEKNQPFPKTTGEYFLSGRLSQVFGNLERSEQNRKWAEVQAHAPALAQLADTEYHLYREEYEQTHPTISI